MYMDALESEVESLSAEVTRLRLMLQRVTQVMEFPVSVDSLPPLRGHSGVSPTSAEPPLAARTAGATPAGTVTIPVELLQTLLDLQRQQQKQQSDATSSSPHHVAPSRSAPEDRDARRTRRRTSHSLESEAHASTSTAATSVARESSASREHRASQSAADKSKEKVASTTTATVSGKSGSSSGTRAPAADEPRAAPVTRSSSVLANPVTADWRLPSPMSNVAPPRPQSRLPSPPPAIAAPPPHDAVGGHDRSRATVHSQSDSAMPVRHISPPTRSTTSSSSADDSESAATTESGDAEEECTEVSKTSRRGSEAMTVSNSAWASAMQDYFEGGPSERPSPHPQPHQSQGTSQSAMASGVAAPSASANYTNQSIEFSQQGMFSYSMLGSLANPSPAMSSMQMRSASPTTNNANPVVEEAPSVNEQQAVSFRGNEDTIHNKNKRTDELPSSSHLLNSKKVPRQTSVMTYRSDDTDDEDGEAGPSPAHKDPGRASDRPVGVPLAPAVLGARHSTAAPVTPHAAPEPLVLPQGLGASQPRAHVPGMRTQQHKKSVFDILREQGDDSSDDNNDKSGSGSETRSDGNRRASDSSSGSPDPEQSAGADEAGTRRSHPELTSMTYGTTRDAYNTGFYSPQYTPQESPAAPSMVSPGASLPPGSSYMGYEYDLGLDTSQSRSAAASAVRGDEESSPSGGYYGV